MVDIDNIFELFSEGDNLDGSNDSTTYIDFRKLLHIGLVCLRN